DIPAGSAAIAGIWRPVLPSEPQRLAAQSPGGPALISTDACLSLAEGVEAARLFFESAAPEVRLSTATYLALLSAAELSDRSRVRRFAAAYPVLSLGPVASSRSVELLFQHRDDGLQPLDALVAATALAHEIPLVTATPAPFEAISGLLVVSPYR